MSNEVVSGTVYGLHGPDGVIRYIGLTTRDPRTRLSQHLWEARSGRKTYKNNWMRSVGVDNIRMQIIEYYPDILFEDLKRREVVCIAEARTLGLPLTNSTDGGDGTLGWVASPEIRQKISASRTGKKLSEATRLNMSRSARKGAEASNYQGKLHTKEVRKRMSEAQLGAKNHNYGRPHSIEHKRKLSEAAKRNPTKNLSDANHKRWHVARGMVNPACGLCSNT